MNEAANIVHNIELYESLKGNIGGRDLMDTEKDKIR